MLRRPSDATVPAPDRAAPPKKRGSYSCGRCGLPKKGHVCPSADGWPAHVPLPRSGHRLRRALSFDEDRHSSPLPASAMEDEGLIGTTALVAVENPDGVVEEEQEDEVGCGGEGTLPASCMVEVLRRLSPSELMRAAAVCRGWRECVRRVWRCAEELRLRVSPRSQVGFVGSVLHKCAGLARLTLRMERSSITDTGIRMICNVFSETLSRLLLALCPNITSSGIQFAAAQLPLLQLIDCGMSICDTDSQYESYKQNIGPIKGRTGEYNKCQRLSTTKSSHVYQKLIIKHGNLRKLSLWGCSGLDVSDNA
ncbi:hypothetical protein GW17_00014280 [Ensete ventricosum]|nr:hypothetical protein GW17_00014280 [Ensete ventricosum]RZR81996.1 hypothetical protein BHM03_00008333 [Ensete ventricosum]